MTSWHKAALTRTESALCLTTFTVMCLHLSMSVCLYMLIIMHQCYSITSSMSAKLSWFLSLSLICCFFLSEPYVSTSLSLQLSESKSLSQPVTLGLKSANKTAHVSLLATNQCLPFISSSALVRRKENPISCKQGKNKVLLAPSYCGWVVGKEFRC